MVTIRSKFNTIKNTATASVESVLNDNRTKSLAEKTTYLQKEMAQMMLDGFDHCIKIFEEYCKNSHVLDEIKSQRGELDEFRKLL